MTPQPPPRKRAVSGVVWSAVSGGGAVLLPFGIFVLFARLMTPEQLGLVAICVAAAEFLKAVGPRGFYEVLVQLPEEERQSIGAASAGLLASGVLLSLVYWGVLAVAILPRHGDAAGAAAGGATPWILGLLGIKIILDTAVLQPQAMLARRLQYARMGVRTITSNLLAGAVGIGLALTLDPVTGLVLYYVLQALSMFLMTVVGTGTLVRPAFHWPSLRAMGREAGHASLVRLSGALQNYFDQLTLSAVAATETVALFNLARRLEIALTTVGAQFSAILYQPLFAVSEKQARGGILEQGLSATTLICGIPTVVFVVNHQLLVPFIFGQQWVAAAPVAAALLVSGLCRAYGGILGALMSVTGRNFRLLVFSLTSAVTGLVITAVVGPIDIAEAAAGLALKNALFLIPASLLVRDALPRLAGPYLKLCLLPLAAVGLVAYGAAAAVGQVFAEPGPLAVLSITAASAVAAYAVGVPWLIRKVMR
jgi:PST family polysaccharide transporter